jgi:hypothetical protein
MDRHPPPAVSFAAAYQVVLGVIWLLQLGMMPSFLLRLFLFGVAFYHFRAAYGLYTLCEWGRQRALQLAVFDLLTAVSLWLGDHLSPLGALLQIGMPAYTIHALNDPEVRRRFS